MSDPESPTLPTLDPATGSRFNRLVAQYYQDHSNPINHLLHVGVGWPIMAAAVVLVPFRPLWSLGLFILSYGVMWFGHFAFERNKPTIFRHPTTPFVMAWIVSKDLARRLARLATTAQR